MERVYYTISENDSGKRLDAIIRKILPGVPLGKIFSMIRKGLIRLNDKKADGSTRVKTNDTIGLPSHLQQQVVTNKPSSKVTSNSANLPPVLYEDDDILIVDKPRGVTTHGPQSIETCVRKYLRGRIGESLTFSPGPLHRLDKNTSGINVFSKSIAGARLFSKAIKHRRVQKYYTGIIEGVVFDTLTWEDILKTETGTKTAVLEVRPVITDSRSTLCLFRLHTGRKHQIRKQAGLRDLPLKGDTAYGSSFSGLPYALHAVMLIAEKEAGLPFRTIVSALPSYFTDNRYLSLTEKNSNMLHKDILRVIAENQ